MVDRGGQCMKMKMSSIITQVCDYTPGVESICAANGNPKSCCTISGGHGGGSGQIICSNGADFTKAPKESDFDSCSTPCPGTGGTQAPTSGPTGPTKAPTKAPTADLVWSLLLTGIKKISDLLGDPKIAALLAKGIADALGIDAARVLVKNIQDVTDLMAVQGHLGRRLQAGSVRLDVTVKHDDKKPVTQKDLDKHLTKMAPAMNKALSNGGHGDVDVGDVKAAPPILGPDPCAPQTTVAPPPSNPCAPSVKASVDGKMLLPQTRTVSFVGLALGGLVLGLVALGIVRRGIAPRQRAGSLEMGVGEAERAPEEAEQHTYKALLRPQAALE